LYLDQGYGVAAEFIAEQLFSKTAEIVEKRLWQDPKSRFQELAQEHLNLTPTYATHGQVGPDQARVFSVGVLLGKEKIGEGKGRAKQEAEQEAALQAIKEKNW